MRSIGRVGESEASTNARARASVRGPALPHPDRFAVVPPHRGFEIHTSLATCGLSPGAGPAACAHFTTKPPAHAGCTKKSPRTPRRGDAAQDYLKRRAKGLAGALARPSCAW